MGARNALSAVIIVFGVLANLIVVLFALAGVLACLHAWQRKNRVRWDVASEKGDLREQVLNLTMGDLVMDRELADLVENRAWREPPAASHGEPDPPGSVMN